MKSWKAARAMVAPGGTLVFAVCSLEREEGEEQIAAFLSGASGIFARAHHGGGSLRSCRLDHAGRRPAHPALSPADGGMDGFYAARLQRA